MDADVVALIEIESNGGVAVGDLLNGPNGINASCGPYDFIETGVLGSDLATVAFIYSHEP
jgi:predicted extracellular nuclease